MTAALVGIALALITAAALLYQARRLRLAHTPPDDDLAARETWATVGEDQPSCFGCGRYACDGTMRDCPVYELLDQESAS